MEFNSTPLKRELQKLENALKGSALLLTMSGDNMYTPEERIAEMKAIEELTRYIRNYDRNKKIKKRHKRNTWAIDAKRKRRKWKRAKRIIKSNI